MNSTIIEIPKDPDKDDNYFIYFLYDKEGDILYIGKTTKLRARIRHHLVAELVKLEPWRETVDRSNIKTIKCHNACDMELYETYFINKYKPIYNRDKVYNCLSTFDLPYIEPVIFKFSLSKIIGSGSFKDNCIRYIESEEDREELAIKYPLIKQAHEELGSIKMKALNYLPEKLTEELNFQDSNNQELIKTELLKILVVGNFYPLVDLKQIMNNIYYKFNINKKGKAVDISNYVTAKFKTMRKEDKFIKGAEILHF